MSNPSNNSQSSNQSNDQQQPGHPIEIRLQGGLYVPTTQASL